jgi:hypothetical protein
MENENEQLQDVDIDEIPLVEEGQEDTTDWKALALKNHGIAKRLKTKLEKSKDAVPDKSEPNKVEAKNNGLDFGQLAFNNSKSDAVKIEADEDIEYLEKTMKETGKSQKDILGSNWFKSEMKERQELRASREATPSHDKRSTTSGKDTVEYWLNKGGLPTNPELRFKVVNARIARENGTSEVSGSSVISNSSSGIEIR